MTTLCIDFGNTRLKAGVFSNDAFMEEVSIEAPDITSIGSLLDRFKPDKCILSSVILHDVQLEKYLAERTRFHSLSCKSQLNFSIAVSKPETIGPDRLALSAAACSLYPGKNNLIIGMGRCITYNFISASHVFLGGAISPGMDMRFRAMHEQTARLPQVSFVPSIPLTGYDTVTNLQSGVVNGIAGEIDGFIDKYLIKYGNFNAVLTGGHSPHFAGQLKNRIFADIHFLYKGLYVLSELNN